MANAAETAVSGLDLRFENFACICTSTKIRISDHAVRYLRLRLLQRCRNGRHVVDFAYRTNKLGTVLAVAGQCLHVHRRDDVMPRPSVFEVLIQHVCPSGSLVEMMMRVDD